MSQTQVQSGFIGDDTVTTAKIAANAITTAKLDSTVSNALVPVGGIIMWSGTIQNIPTGWALCNGQEVNGQKTPDLANKFVVGAHRGDGNGTVATTGPTFDAETGAQIASYTPGNIGGEIAHKLTVTELASHNHTAALYRGEGSSFAGGTVNNGQLNQAGGVTFTGGDNYHENRPPYYALAFIMRVS